MFVAGRAGERERAARGGRRRLTRRHAVAVDHAGDLVLGAQAASGGLPVWRPVLAMSGVCGMADPLRGNDVLNR